MKRIIALCLAVVCVFMAVGCNSSKSSNSEAPDLLSGIYEAVGDYDENLTPCVIINTENSEFGFYAGAAISFVRYGAYEVKDGVIIATTQTTTYKFEIKDSKTLVLIEIVNNDYPKIPIGTQFALCDSK